MKILEVTNLFSPLHGGSAEVSHYLSKELVKRGHQVTIYTSDFKLRKEYLVPATEVKVHAFKTWLGLAEFHVTPGIIKKTKDEIRHFDIIHMHNYRTFQNIITHHYAKKYAVPYVLQAHGSLATFFQKRWLKRIFDRIWGHRILKDASMFIASTPVETEQYRNMGISEQKIEIVANGIDLPEFDNLPMTGEFRRKYGLASAQRIILYLGRIHKIKGLDLLVKAFADLSKSLNNIKLIITGPDDGHLASLKKLIADLEISDKVLFTGALYGREKLRAYVDADVYVLPSVYETFPIAVLEACACGTPVVLTDRCGIADVIDGQAGLVVPYDKEQLQYALLHMLDDDKMRLRFGEKGKLLVREKFSWENIAEQVEKVYEEAFGSKFVIKQQSC